MSTISEHQASVYDLLDELDDCISNLPAGNQNKKQRSTKIKAKAKPAVAVDSPPEHVYVKKRRRTRGSGSAAGASRATASTASGLTIATTATMMNPSKCRRAMPILLAIATAGVLFLSSNNATTKSLSSYLRNYDYVLPTPSMSRQLLTNLGEQLLSPHNNGTTDDPSSNSTEAIAARRRKNCQFLYILGVEGAGHAEFSPLMKKMIERQVDPRTGLHYRYHDPADDAVQRAIFGRRPNKRPVDDPALIRELLEEICPDDGVKHVLPLATSFPSRGAGDAYYPTPRQKAWTAMDMTRMANSGSALKHPLNLRAFYRAYGPHVDVKFVALSSPFIEAVTSHMGNDGGPEEHMAVLSGYLMLIRRFLDWTDKVVVTNRANGGGAGHRIWTLVCMEQLYEKFYYGDQSGSDNDNALSNVVSARNEVVYRLARFLKWPQDRCDDCFDHWSETGDHTTTNDNNRNDGDDDKDLPAATKKRTPSAERKLLWRGTQEGKPHILELYKMKMEVLDGVWPPRMPDGRRGRHQQCRA